MIMEYAENGNLFTHQNQKNIFTEAESYKYFIQTLQGVQYLHQSNIMHRDLKVTNRVYSQKIYSLILIITLKYVIWDGLPRIFMPKERLFVEPINIWHPKCYSSQNMIIVSMFGLLVSYFMNYSMDMHLSKAKMQVKYSNEC